jgi:hypothetical protein
MTLLLDDRESAVIGRWLRACRRRTHKRAEQMDVLAGLRVALTDVPQSSTVEYRLLRSGQDVLNYEVDDLDDFEKEMLKLSNALFRERKRAEQEW